MERRYENPFLLANFYLISKQRPRLLRRKQIYYRHSNPTTTAATQTSSLTQKSFLKKLDNRKEKDLNQLKSSLQTLGTIAKTVYFQSIPGHCELPGNDKTETLAKEGQNMEQPEKGCSHKETKKHIMAAFTKQSKEAHSNYNPGDPIKTCPGDNSPYCLDSALATAA